MVHLAGLVTARAEKPETVRPVFQPIEDDPALPRVLLIGDSISIGYTLKTRELLAGKANVHRPPSNCGHTGKGLDGLDEWLGEKPWDVIHFNWGLHDLKFVKRDERAGLDLDGGEQVHSVEAYAANLELLVTRLEHTGARLVWASTTPIPEGAAGRKPEDAVRYNEAAAAVMKRNCVDIDDLYTAVLPRLGELQRPSNVHFLPEGSAFLAEQVAASILHVLNRDHQSETDPGVEAGR